LSHNINLYGVLNGEHNNYRAYFYDILINFVSIKSKLNVGIIPWWDIPYEALNTKKLEEFLKEQDISFFVSEELFDRLPLKNNLEEIFELLNKYNVWYITSSTTSDVYTNKERTYYTPWFFKSKLYIPKTFTVDLKYNYKPFTYNLLLGSKKPYRTVLFHALNHEKIYSTYFGHPIYKHYLKENLDDDDIKKTLIEQDVTHEKINTMKIIYRDNMARALSHIIPETIYKKSHFDIVAETLMKTGTYFLTEKTAKPIATGRFFCWFTSSHVVNHLHNFGFNFDDYNTEYDYIPDDFTRLELLLEFINKTKDDETHIKSIYKRTEAAREHNMLMYFKHIEEYNNNLRNWIIDIFNNFGKLGVNTDTRSISVATAGI